VPVNFPPQLPRQIRTSRRSKKKNSKLLAFSRLRRGEHGSAPRSTHETRAPSAFPQWYFYAMVIGVFSSGWSARYHSRHRVCPAPMFAVLLPGFGRCWPGVLAVAKTLTIYATRHRLEHRLSSLEFQQFGSASAGFFFFTETPSSRLARLAGVLGARDCMWSVQRCWAIASYQARPAAHSSQWCLGLSWPPEFFGATMYIPYRKSLPHRQ